jgi:hypothetical protein
METKAINEYLLQWIFRDVCAPPKGGSIPVCPFAKQAMLSQKVDIEINDTADFCEFADNRIETLSLDKEMLILVEPDIERYTDDWAKEYCNDRNKKLREMNKIVLKDHPANPGMIDSASTSNGRFLLLFIQHFDKLNEASKALHQTDYYKNWSREFYDELVGSRSSEVDRTWPK